MSNTKVKLTKNLAKAKQHLQTELLLFENYSCSSSTLSSKNSKKYSKTRAKKKKYVCFNDIA